MTHSSSSVLSGGMREIVIRASYPIAEIGAFLDYAESGGAVLLTGWAIRHATNFGLEKAVARQFGPVPERRY